MRRVREIRVVPGSVDYLPNAFVNGVNRAEVELACRLSIDPRGGIACTTSRSPTAPSSTAPAHARFVGDVAVKDGVIVEVSRSPLAGRRRRDRRRHRAAGHARFRRHPHPLRRPGHVGPAARAVVGPRRHHGGRGQLRRRVRARAPGRREVADQPDGRRRGHPRHRAHRGHRLELGDVPGVPRRARPTPVRDRRRACRCRTARCVRTRWGSGARRTSRRRPTRSRRWPPSCRTRWKPARWASRRRARSVTAQWTVGRCRARSQPRTSCSRSGAPCDAPAAACSSSRRSAPRGKTCWRPSRRWRGCVDSPRSSTSPSRSRCCRSTPRRTRGGG